MESKLQSLSGNLSVKLSVSFVMKSVMTGVMCSLGAVLMNAQSNFLSLCFLWKPHKPLSQISNRLLSVQKAHALQEVCCPFVYVWRKDTTSWWSSQKQALMFPLLSYQTLLWVSKSVCFLLAIEGLDQGATSWIGLLYMYCQIDKEVFLFVCVALHGFS